MTYNPPSDPATKQSPCDNDLYFKGRTSAGMAWVIDILVKVTPMSIPPPIRVDIVCAFADTTAPAKATRGGKDAKYLRSTTSESRPTMGESTA